MKKKIILLVAFALLISNAVFASQDLSAEGKKNLRSANMHLTGGRYEKALPLYESVLEENPNNIVALEKVAGIYFDVDKNYLEANNYYERLIDQIDLIFAEYEKLKTENEKDAKKFYKKYMKKADLDEKLENTKKLIASCWTKLFLEAQELFKNEQYDDSIAKFIVLNEIAPDSTKTLKMLAFAYNKKGDEEKSLEYMIKTTELDANDDMACTQIANTYFGKEDFDNAIIWYDKASQINPGNIDNFYNLALAYDKLEDDDNVLKYNLKVHELDPENLDAIINLSNKYAKMSDIDKSIEFLKKAIVLDPENVDFVEFLSWKLSQEKRYEELLTYANKWKELVPDSEDAQNLINLAKQKLKQ